jgi:hypothetical protein
MEYAIIYYKFLNLHNLFYFYLLRSVTNAVDPCVHPPTMPSSLVDLSKFIYTDLS